MSKKFYTGTAMAMLGMAVLVPMILQEPLPAISGESSGAPAVSGLLDNTPRQNVAAPDESAPQEAERADESAEAAPPLPPTEAMTMSVGSGSAKPAPAAMSEEASEASADSPASSVSPAKQNGAQSVRQEDISAQGKGEDMASVGEEVKQAEQVQAKDSSAQEEVSRPKVLVTRGKLPSEDGTSVITNATLRMDGDVVTLRLEANSPISGKTFILSGPDRVVLDLSGDWKLASPRVPSNRMLRELRVGKRSDGIRLVFDMRVKPVKASVKQVSADILELSIR